MDLLTLYGPNNELLLSNTWTNTHQLASTSNAAGDVTSYTYDANFRLSTCQWPSGLTRTYSYDPNSGFLSEISDSPVFASEFYTWQNGLPRTYTDARGLQRTFTWDNLQRITQITWPDNSYQSFGYTALDLTSGRDRLGNVTQFAYNAIRQLVSVTDANSHTTSYGYCACEGLAEITNALSQVTQFIRDGAGRLTEVIHADGTYVSYGYNLLGQVTSVADALGTTMLAYNNQGLRVSVTSPAGSVAQVVYDNEDRASSVTDANGVTESQTFDNLGRVLSRATRMGASNISAMSGAVWRPTPIRLARCGSMAMTRRRGGRVP